MSLFAEVNYDHLTLKRSEDKIREENARIRKIAAPTVVGTARVGPNARSYAEAFASFGTRASGAHASGPNSPDRPRNDNGEETARVAASGGRRGVEVGPTPSTTTMRHEFASTSDEERMEREEEDEEDEEEYEAADAMEEDDAEEDDLGDGDDDDDDELDYDAVDDDVTRCVTEALARVRERVALPIAADSHSHVERRNTGTAVPRPPPLP